MRANETMYNALGIIFFVSLLLCYLIDYFVNG